MQSIDELKEVLDPEVYSAFEEFRVTARLMDYEMSLSEDGEDLYFEKMSHTVGINFYIGLARVSYIRVYSYGSSYNSYNGKYEKKAWTIEEQLELMEDIQNLLD